MDGELPAVPLVAVRDREAHHPGARFEVRHASAQPLIDRAGADVEAPSDLPLADPSAACGITGMSRAPGQGGSRGMPQLAKRDGNQEKGKRGQGTISEFQPSRCPELLFQDPQSFGPTRLGGRKSEIVP